MLKLVLLMALLTGTLVFDSTIANAGESVRFYELTKKDKEKRIFNLGSMEGPGCHNFLRKQWIHRFSQVGFKSCTLYSEKKCNPESIVRATWTGKSYKRAEIDIEVAQTEILPGTKWVLAERNQKIRSWSCIQN